MKLRYPIFCFALLCVLLEGCMLPGYMSEYWSHKAGTAFRENRLEDARGYYEKIISRYDTEPSAYLPALHNLGVVLLKTGHLEDAEQRFHQLLALEMDTAEMMPHARHGIIDLYKFYKNSAALELAGMRLRAGKFQEALVYIQQAEAMYLDGGDPGTVGLYRRFPTANAYADYYEATGNVDEAIKVILPHTYPYWFAEGNGAVERSIRLLAERYTSEERRRIVEEADRHMRIERREMPHKISYTSPGIDSPEAKPDTSTFTSITAYVPMLGTEIMLWPVRSPSLEGPALPEMDAPDETWLAYYRAIFRKGRLYTFLSSGGV